MKNDYIIRLETPNDYRKAENLTCEAFWNVYHPGRMEQYVLHVLRDDPYHNLRPHQHRAGISAQGCGTPLLRRSMEAARKLGAGALLISGNTDFHGKSSFVAASTKDIHGFTEPRNAEAFDTHFVKLF